MHNDFFYQFARVRYTEPRPSTVNWWFVSVSVCVYMSITIYNCATWFFGRAASLERSVRRIVCRLTCHGTKNPPAHKHGPLGTHYQASLSVSVSALGCRQTWKQLRGTTDNVEPVCVGMFFVSSCALFYWLLACLVEITTWVSMTITPLMHDLTPPTWLDLMNVQCIRLILTRNL